MLDLNTLTTAAIFRKLAKNDSLIFSYYITKNSISRSYVSSKSKNVVFLGEKEPMNEYEITRSWHPRNKRNLRVIS